MLDWLGDVPAAAGPVGWPLAEVGDPFALEVRRRVEPDVPQPVLPVLPVYVPREHDAAMAAVVTGAAARTGLFASRGQGGPGDAHNGHQWAWTEVVERQQRVKATIPPRVP